MAIATLVRLYKVKVQCMSSADGKKSLRNRCQARFRYSLLWCCGFWNDRPPELLLYRGEELGSRYYTKEREVSTRGIMGAQAVSSYAPRSSRNISFVNSILRPGTFDNLRRLFRRLYRRGCIVKDPTRVARLASDAFCILGITMEDLYPGASWNFVFGQAPAFYGERQTRDCGALVLRRSCKVLAHETALAHCIYFNCLMNGSNHLA
jgi:hypothetical protein